MDQHASVKKAWVFQSKSVGVDYVKYQSDCVVKKDITALTLLSLRELRPIYIIELDWEIKFKNVCLKSDISGFLADISDWSDKVNWSEVKGTVNFYTEVATKWQTMIQKWHFDIDFVNLKKLFYHHDVQELGWIPRKLRDYYVIS